MTGRSAQSAPRRQPGQQRAAAHDRALHRDITARLNDQIADLSRKLLGDPNPRLSTASQLRFGTKGSIAVEVDGPKAGYWFDHERGIGGDGLEMVRQHYDPSTGTAQNWARRWLAMDAPGADNPAPPAAPNPRSANVRRKSRREEEAATKVADIITHCEDLAGTPAEAYLRSRGIIIASPPPALRFLANAHDHYGALVALATDADGAVHAVQQIYVTDDGRKAPLKVQKRTNKARDGWSDVAAVRLPGTKPLVLAEGVESALSVWQATGQETWACLGISNIARAPVPNGTSIVVARDGDMPGSKADNQLRRTITILRGQGREVAVAEPPTGKDFNDLLVGDGAQAIRDLISGALSADSYSIAWRHDLLVNHEREPRPVLANAIHALRRAPEWEDVLWYDEFAAAIIARKPPPWTAGRANWADTPWSDRDDLLVADWMQRQGIMVPASVAGQAVEAVARDRLFHPVREYLDRLCWDDTPRIDTWLSVYLGAEDSSYFRAVGPRWLMSAIARIYRPGAQADCALILEGPQGIRKSSALRTLGQPWFTDRLSDLSGKDAAMETKGVWIIEVAELDSISRADVRTIKAFISRSCDRFRPPYGKRLVDLPRQCVFAGSVNPEGGYLKDATGGRRFWPVRCGAIDLDALDRDRDQLWAEARERYRVGEPWWLESRDLEALAIEQQADRYQGDAWDEPISSYLECMVSGHSEPPADRQSRREPLDDVSVAEVLEKALGIEKGRWTQADQNRVVRSLVSMGFKQYRARHDGQRERRYRRVRLAEEFRR